MCSAAGLKLLAYYHNEHKVARMCVTHTSHINSSKLIQLKLVQGNWQKENIYAQAAIMAKPLRNTTVLLVKPDFKAPYRFNVIPAISGRY